MFFLLLSSCDAEYLNINKTNKTIIFTNQETLEIEIETNIKDLILLKVENNNKFEYELNKTESGYILTLTIYDIQSFSKLTFKSARKLYNMDIGKINVVPIKKNITGNVNIILDGNMLYIFNKTDKTIVIDDIIIYGGTFYKAIKYDKFISQNKLVLLGDIYNSDDHYVLLVRYRYNEKVFEEVIET